MPPGLSQPARRLLLALRVVASLVIALHLVVPLFPEEIAWGLWPVTYLPAPVRTVLALAALVLAWGGDRLWQALPAANAALARVRFTSPSVRLAISLLAGVCFYLFRIQHLGWGDAKLLVKALGDPYRLTYVWQAPLDVFLHAKGWQLGNALFGWTSPVPVYRILSTLAGVVFVWVLIGLAARLGRNRAERAVTVGLVLTLGTMQLFFGYVENYPLMTLGVLVYAYLALRCLAGEIALAWPAIALAVTHALHPSTIILAPSLLYLAFAPLAGAQARQPEDQAREPEGRARQPEGQARQPEDQARQPEDQAPGNDRHPGGVPRARGWRVDARSVLSVAVPYALVFAGVVALMTAGDHGLDALMGVDFPGGGDRIWFVPLFEITTKWQHYTMFSVGHLVDIVNQQLLVAPMVWPSLILIALLARRRLPREDATGRFLLVMAGCHLLLTLVWNADYGGQKDWDLFSPAAVPAALLLAWALPRALAERSAFRAGAWAIIATQAFHLVAWIWRNTLAS